MTYENVAVRMLCADTHPDHDTICAFRRNNGKLLAEGFAHFSDPESRIMPLGGKGAFGQAYNAQAGVEIDSRLIVTQRVSNAPNDKKELAANVAAINPAVESVATGTRGQWVFE